MTTFSIFTLGCKVNIYESFAVRDEFEATGKFIYNDDPFSSDVVIINSCMVTEEAEKKAAKFVRRVKRENEKAIIVFTGCMSQIVPDKVEKLGAHIIMGNTRRLEILPETLKLLSENERSSKKIVEKHLLGETFEVISPNGYESLTRANLKIEDGCDCYCSYCIIPYARGHVRSMGLTDVYNTAKKLVDAGHKEIVLTGINLGMYGKDIGLTLYDACFEVKRAGAERIRLGSLEIDLLGDDTVRKLATIEGFCPQFHTSLQSGSDTVLKRMNRKYTTDEYMNRVSLLRSSFVNPAITTDIIVGFPGETEEEFQESVDFANKVGFSRVHVFPYSRRPGTVADKMVNQVPPEVKKKRAQTMGKNCEKLHERFMESQIGCHASVLFEIKEDDFWCGHTENFIYVLVKSDENLKNQIRSVKLTEIIGENMLGILDNFR